jgi:ribose/xylose/arabinose/galactoside ABC-type transport system permease subunit
MTIVPASTQRQFSVSRLRRGAERLILSEYLVLLLTLVYFLAMLPIVPSIATATVMLDIVNAMAPLLVVAIGQTFVLIVAGIDLSAPSILAMASVVGASVITGDNGYLMDSPFVVPVGIIVFLAVGAGIGCFNGTCTARLGMPSFIVTLTTMMFFSGAAIWYTALHTDASSIGNLPPSFIWIGEGEATSGLPVAILVAAAVGLAAHFVLNNTVYGRWLYAIGTNMRAAEISGVPVRRAVMWAFVISGLCAGISSVLYTGRLETGTPVLGQRILLDVIGAAVIGGVSLFGGKGKIVWTLFGVLFLAVIDKSLQLLGLTLSSVFAIKGGVILLAAVIDAVRHRLLVRQ